MRQGFPFNEHAASFSILAFNKSYLLCTLKALSCVGRSKVLLQLLFPALAWAGCDDSMERDFRRGWYTTVCSKKYTALDVTAAAVVCVASPPACVPLVLDLVKGIGVELGSDLALRLITEKNEETLPDGKTLKAALLTETNCKHCPLPGLCTPLPNQFRVCVAYNKMPTMAIDDKGTSWQCYLSRYPDLTKAFGATNIADARNHWFQYGKDEQRSVTCDGVCNWECYLDRYPDLQQAFGKTGFEQAARHWSEFGEQEGRNCKCTPGTECQWQCYLNRYEDLRNAFGPDNIASARNHYYEFGKAEGRTCRC